MNPTKREETEIDDADVSEIEAEVEAARFDDDPNPYEGTYSDDGDF